jgi:hypothetical protein
MFFNNWEEELLVVLLLLLFDRNIYICMGLNDRLLLIYY